jgi:hypothetical protein
VYDGILKRFKSAHLLSKVNDAGGRLIRAMDEKQLFTYPESSNPSVSNTGLAVAAELVFKEVYLVGTDFGVVSQEHHHSKHSIYFDKDFKHKELIKKNMQSDMVVKGNFRDEVLSTHIFDSSKGNVEILLQSNPQVTAYNTSDGAFIRFTTPKRIADISLKNTIKNKQEMVSELLKRATSLEQLSLGNIDSKMTAIKSGTKAILEKLLLITSAHFNTRESLADAFTLQNKILLMLRDGNSNDHVVYWLIQGTFRYFQAYIMTNSYYYRCLEQRAEFMNACIDAFHSHVEDLYIEFIENYNKSAKL